MKRSRAADTLLLLWVLGLAWVMYLLATVVAVGLSMLAEGGCEGSRCAESSSLPWTLWVSAGGALLLGTAAVPFLASRGDRAALKWTAISLAVSAICGVTAGLV